MGSMRQRHPAIGSPSPAEFEKRALLAWDAVYGTGSSPLLRKLNHVLLGAA
jgi:hypothetical protein